MAFWRGGEPLKALSTLGRPGAVRRPRPPDEVAGIAAAAEGLNISQCDAVHHAATHALTLLWEPPGTGKTKTATALVHGCVRYEAAHLRERAYAILLTGPNYKAIAELVGSMESYLKIRFDLVHRELLENYRP